MLRHLKMELKRREFCEQQQQQQLAQAPVEQQITAPKATAAAAQSKSTCKQAANEAAAKRRVRGRRSSKPQMEKRRRARINECLDILKSYVLTDTNNLHRLGVDTSDVENRDEETIAQTILKSSGLIHRHKGRKNPNKLEKADILELTVDYVRRLHEQRDELMSSCGGGNIISTQKHTPVPKRLLQPLTISLTPLEGQQQQQQQQAARAMPSPPPSSASSSSLSSGGSSYSLLSRCSSTASPASTMPQQQQQQQQQQPLLVISNLMHNGDDVLDLSSGNQKRAQQNQLSSCEAESRWHTFASVAAAAAAAANQNRLH